MNKTVLAVVGVVALLFLAFGGTYVGMSIHYHNQFNTDQNNLQAKYNANRAELAKYSRQIETEVGIAGIASAQLDKVLQDAVSGQYNLKDPNKGGANGQPSLFSALVEAYPNLSSNQAMYSKIIQDVSDDEQAFQNDQQVLAQQAASFQTELENAPGGWFAGGYPTNNLWAYSQDSAGNLTKVYGMDALKQMQSLVTNSESNGAYGSGTYNGPTLPTPVPAPSH